MAELKFAEFTDAEDSFAEFQDAPDGDVFAEFQDAPETPIQAGVRATRGALQATELLAAPTAWANQAVGEMNRLQGRAAQLDQEANVVLGNPDFADPRQQEIAQGYRAASLQERQKAEAIGNKLREVAPEIIDRPVHGAPVDTSAWDRANFMGRGASQILQSLGSDTLASQVESIGASPLGLNFQANIGPAAGGAAGAALMTIPGGQSLGARALLPMVGEVAAPIAGAFTGAAGGGMAQERLQRIGESPEQTQSRHDVLAETQQNFPVQSMIGQSLANAPFMAPSLSVINEAMKGNRVAQAAVGGAAAIGGTMGALPAAIGGQPFSMAQIAQGALENVLFNKPTRLGRALGLPAVETGRVAEKTGFEPITIEPNAKPISETGTPDGGVRPPEVAGENAPLPTDVGGEGVQPSGQGEPLAQATPEATREVGPKLAGTAIRLPDGTPMRGDSPDQSHAELNLKALEAVDPKGETDYTPKTEDLGFAVKNPDGTETFVDRTEAMRLAKEQGVVPADHPATELTSEILKEVSSAPVRPVAASEPPTTTPEPVKADEAQEAAVIAESEPTGIRNAIVDRARQERGIAERDAVATRAYSTLWDETKALVQNDPTAGTRLVESLKKEMRPLRDDQDALLTHEQTKREAELDAAMEGVNNARTPEEQEAAQLRFAEAQNAVHDVYQVGQSAGTANARGLAARRMMINRDFSLAKMMSRYRAEINGGAPLSKNQQAEVIAANKRIKELETRLSDTEDKLAVAEAQNVFTELKRTARKEASSPQRRSVVDFLTEKEAAAMERIKARRGRLNVTIDPLNLAGLADEIIIGTAKIARGVRDFAKWSKEMLDTFGDRIKPQLQAMFNRATQIEAETAAMLTGKEPASKAPVGALDQKAIFDRARALVQEGATDLEPVIQTITKEIQAKDPTVTERQVRDVFSGYGKTTQPSKEADLTQLRELRNLARLTSQLEDAQRGVAPLKTGPQRDKATARVRELQRQVSVAMRKAGLDTGDPATQLASAHTARVTRLKNAIEETQKNIAEKKRTESPNPVPWTPEEIALRDQLDELKIRLDDVLNEPDSAQLDRLSKRIADVTDRIIRGDIEPRSKVQGPATKEVAAAQLELAKLNKELSDMRKAKRDAGNPKKSQDQKTEELLEKRRDQLLEDIRKGDIAAKYGKPTAETLRQSELRSEIADLNKQKAQMRKDATPGKPADEAAFRSIEKRLAEAKARLAAGDIEPKPAPATVATKRVTEARAELAEVNRQIQELRAGSEDLRLANDKKRIQAQTKKLQDRIAAGDYAPRTKREPVLDDEKLDLQFKLAEEKRKWNEGFLEQKRANRTMGEKARDTGLEVLNTSRAMLTSADLSAVLRQGGFIGLGNPARAIKSLPAMFKAFASEKSAFKTMRDIESRPNAPLYESSGLYLARDSNDLKSMEEAYASRWAQHIPLVRGSARAYTTFLNKLRADTFDALHAQLSAKTPAANKALANYINAATGRGKFGFQTLENSAQLLNSTFFAPRYVASRFQLILGQPMAGGTMETRKLIAKEYAKFLAGIATVYGLGKLAGGEIERDPRSSDFGKIRFGRTRLDMLAGLSQSATLIAREITGETKEKGRIRPLEGNEFTGSNRIKVAGRFLRTKFSPALGALVDWGTGKNVVGEKVTGKDVLQRSVIPIGFQDVLKHMEAQGVPRGTALFILSLFGAGLQTYDTKR